MMKLKVNISEEDANKLYQQVREELRGEITEEAVKNYMLNAKDLNILELVRDFGIYTKYEEIKHMRLDDLNNNQKLITVLFWLMYDQLVG